MEDFQIWLIASAISLCIIIAAIFNYFYRIKIKKSTYHLGITWLFQLKELLVLIQQHRGLTTGYINGDKELQKRIIPLQTAIKTATLKLTHHGDWINQSEFWQGITDHWSRLLNKYKNSTSIDNYNQHNSLIANILFLIEECAESHQLQELYFDNNEPVSFLWQKLLYSAEYIGQARALGTGIAAAENATSVERIKLNYLKSRINELIKTNHLQDIEPDLTKLLTCITHQLLSDKPDIQPEVYFNLATASLTKVFQKFDQLLSSISNK